MVLSHFMHRLWGLRKRKVLKSILHCICKIFISPGNSSEIWINLSGPPWSNLCGRGSAHVDDHPHRLWQRRQGGGGQEGPWCGPWHALQTPEKSVGPVNFIFQSETGAWVCGRSTKDFNCVCSNLLISIKTLNVKTKNIFVVLFLKILNSTAIFPSLLKRQSLVWRPSSMSLVHLKTYLWWLGYSRH